MNRIDAGNFSRRFVGVSKRLDRRRDGTRRACGRRAELDERERGERRLNVRVNGRRKTARDDRTAGKTRRVERNEFFDVESKTIVTIGKYEKEK